MLEGEAAFAHAAQEIFLLNDLDGDGTITREEWLGTDAVFDALDTDHDGCLKLEKSVPPSALPWPSQPVEGD